MPIVNKSPDVQLHIIPAFSAQTGQIKEGYKLVYMGKILDSDEEDAQVVSLPRKRPAPGA